MSAWPSREQTESVRQRSAAADCRRVAIAADLLSVKEFDFFRMAYRRWFGRQPDDRSLERAFGAYMLRQIVPPWVRHLATTVLEQRRAGTLDAEALGAGRYRDRMQRHPQGRLYFSVTVLIWLILFAMLLDTRYHPETSAPVPPCAETSGAWFYDAWAGLLTGRRLPACTDDGER